jgi:hypothetical protein
MLLQESYIITVNTNVNTYYFQDIIYNTKNI